MAETNPKVLAMVGRELEKNSKVPNQELFEKATKIDSSIAELSPREFHARYPLQWKRQRARGAEVPVAAAASAAPEPEPAGRKAGRRGARRPGRPRRQAAAAEAAAAPAPAATPLVPEPAGIRRVMLQFASDVAGAESRRDLVKVLADIDKYVDRVTKAIATK